MHNLCCLKITHYQVLCLQTKLELLYCPIKLWDKYKEEKISNKRNIDNKSTKNNFDYFLSNFCKKNIPKCYFEYFDLTGRVLEKYILPKKLKRFVFHNSILKKYFQKWSRLKSIMGVNMWGSPKSVHFFPKMIQFEINLGVNNRAEGAFTGTAAAPGPEISDFPS